MRIISIDVGMRHLAYCIISKETNDNYSILEWDVIDLCNKKANPCCHTDKHGKPCKRQTKFYKDDKYYCQLHAKKQKFPIPSSEMKITEISIENQTNIIESARSEKEKLLNNATMPIDGLEFGRDDVRFKGIDFTEISQAQKIKTANRPP